MGRARYQPPRRFQRRATPTPAPVRDDDAAVRDLLLLFLSGNTSGTGASFQVLRRGAPGRPLRARRGRQSARGAPGRSKYASASEKAARCRYGDSAAVASLIARRSRTGTSSPAIPASRRPAACDRGDRRCGRVRRSSRLPRWRCQRPRETRRLRPMRQYLFAHGLDKRGAFEPLNADVTRRGYRRVDAESAWFPFSNC